MQATDFLKASIPIGIWKKMSPNAKRVMTKFANENPEKFKAVLEDPQILLTCVKELRPGLYGEFQAIDKNMGPLTQKALK
jgi:hypothetical protein